MASQSFILRSELSSLKPYNVGLSLEDVADRAQGKPIAKLGSNENPYELPSSIRKSMENALVSAAMYPDPIGRTLAHVIAEKWNCAPGQVVFGNGSEDILNILARAILRPGDEVVTLYPSFPLHEDYATMMGATVNAIDLTANHEIDIDALIKAVARPVRMTVFANPMNPTGLWLDGDQLQAVLAAQHPDSLLCLDEAYLEYALHGDADFRSGSDWLHSHDKPLILLRTFSKAYGLAGLRVGYGLTNNADIRRGLDLVRTPFNVNAAAQAGAIAALEHEQDIRPVLETVTQERMRVTKRLRAKGLTVLPSLGNFLFVDVKAPSIDIASQLISEGVIIKPWKQQGYESWIRASIGLESENTQFLQALSKCLGCD
ncbi:histidinol-phosphate transaminase [uncultured Cohaesibacter sp.]|uniref:histidinol-phosphate transaminase n=1 Tax=uncultured Cohaesibacter sp. TaxID=1002546 RepID=UPI00292D5BB1|nr:histidinol-phosphate transaminase [uncultured Cohaesibacter sp.]